MRTTAEPRRQALVVTMTRKVSVLLLALVLLAAADAAPQTGEMTLQSHRITQGLEWHGPPASPSYYDLVAGKDTLVRAVLSSRDEIITATCTMRRGSASRPYTAEVVSAGPETWVASCWIPGADLPEPGIRSFEVRASTASQRQRWTLPLGRNFARTGDLRLLLTPWIFPTGHPEFLPWNDELALNVVEAMMEMNRRFPMPTGVGNFSLTGRGTGSLRFYLNLPATPCTMRPGDTVGTATVRCDAQYRASADFISRLYNGVVSRRRPGADLFDLAAIMVTAPETGGGQSCWAGQISFGVVFDPDPTGGSATVLTHEAAHCMGEVSGPSPNLAAGDSPPGHARVWDIVMPPGLPLVDMRTRGTMATPVTLMNGSVANVYNTYFEAFEWNSLRRGLVRRSGLLASLPGEERPLLAADASDLALQPARGGQSMFGMIATLDRAGKLSVEYSGGLGVLHESVASPDRQSEYQLVFYDKGGKVIRGHGFIPTFDTPDGTTDVTGISLVVPLPPATARLAVERSGKPLHASVCDGVAPSVSSPSVKTDPKGVLRLKWKAAHAQGRELRYAVAFSRDSRQEPLLLAAGLRSNQWEAPASSLPGTNAGTFVITASDGCNVATTKAPPVRIARRAPLVRLRVNRPEESAPGESLTVSAVAWDHTDGVLGGTSLIWYVDDRLAGTGELLSLQPSKTARQVKLVARNSAGMRTVAEEVVR